jgi:hypothetical protein
MDLRGLGLARGDFCKGRPKGCLVFVVGRGTEAGGEGGRLVLHIGYWRCIHVVNGLAARVPTITVEYE